MTSGHAVGVPRRRNYAPMRCFWRDGQHGGDHLTRSVGPPLSLSALVLCRLDGTPDTAMSPHVFDSVSSQAVEVDSVGPSQFACPLPTSAGSSPALATNQFYIQGQQGRLLIRSFNQVRHSVNCCPPSLSCQYGLRMRLCHTQLAPSRSVPACLCVFVCSTRVSVRVLTTESLGVCSTRRWSVARSTIMPNGVNQGEANSQSQDLQWDDGMHEMTACCGGRSPVGEFF